MANGLYIGATREFSGKNMLVVGLGLRLQKEELSIGYMKPFGASSKSDAARDEDAGFAQEVLGLDQDSALVTPVLATQDFKMRAFAGRVPDFMPDIAAAYEKLAENRDLVLVCGANHILYGKYCRLDGMRLVRALGLKALVVDRFQHEVHYDELAHIKEQLGDSFLGAVLNDIPAPFMTEIQSVIKPHLERNGIPVLGVIPHDPLMGSIRAHELAHRLGGRLLTAKDRAERMVENFLIGTMQVENFMTYFRRNPNAAIIVGGDRADVQIVAIEGQCPCLVLTGNLFPNDIILSRAEALNIPIIMVRQDTYAVAKKMEAVLNRHKMHDVMKIRQGAQLVGNNLDFPALRQGLGL